MLKKPLLVVLNKTTETEVCFCRVHLGSSCTEKVLVAIVCSSPEKVLVAIVCSSVPPPRLDGVAVAGGAGVAVATAVGVGNTGGGGGAGVGWKKMRATAVSTASAPTIDPTIANQCVLCTGCSGPPAGT
jgi:hypothetical protein